MSTPTNDDGADTTGAGAEPRVNLGKDGGDDAAAPASEPAFDPYRYGRPDHPIPPEYAPPGYVPDEPAVPPPPGAYPSAPYGQAPYGQSPYGQSPYGQAPYGPPHTPGQYGQPGQAPYGQPYPPPPPGARPGGPAASGSNGKAVTAMVLGIASIVLCWLSFLALFVIVPALVFGIVGLNESKRRGGAGRSMAVAGIACAVVGAVLATVLTIFVLRAADKCGGVENSDDPGFQQCVQDNFFAGRR